MSYAIYYTLGAFLSIYLLWVFYLAVMGLKRAKDEGKLHPVVLALGVPVLITGLLLDFLVNVFVMSVILLELPKEGTVTYRLKRHEGDPSWRGKVVEFFRPLLDPFDPSGEHI